MDWIVSKTKPDFLGKRSFTRADTLARRPQAARRPAAGRPRRAAPRGRVSSSRDAGVAARRYRCSATSRRATAARPSGGRSRSRSCAAAASGSARRSCADGEPAEVVESVPLRQGGHAPRWPSCVSPRCRRRSDVRGEPRPASRSSRTRPPRSPGRPCSGSGRDEWLVLGGAEADFPDAAAAVDVSANRVVFELTGDDAADVLAQGCSLDLDRFGRALRADAARPRPGDPLPARLRNASGSSSARRSPATCAPGSRTRTRVPDARPCRRPPVDRSSQNWHKGRRAPRHRRL